MWRVFLAGNGVIGVEDMESHLGLNDGSLEGEISAVMMQMYKLGTPKHSSIQFCDVFL